MRYRVFVQKVPVTFYILILASLFFLNLTNNAWSEEDKVNHTTLKVDGMTCFLCAPMVKKVLKKLDGVTRTDVSVKEAKAEVDYKEGKVTVNQMIKAIESIGFKASLAKEKMK